MIAKVTALMSMKYAQALERGGDMVRWNTGSSSVWTYRNPTVIARGTRRYPDWYMSDKTMRALVEHGYGHWTRRRERSRIPYEAKLGATLLCPTTIPKKPPATRIES